MGYINYHAKLFHPLYKRKAFLCQSLCIVKHEKSFVIFVIVLHIGTRKFILIIPGQCHHPRAKIIQRFQIFEFSLTASALLDGHQSRQFSPLFIFKNIRIRFYDADIILIFCHLIIKHICQLQNTGKGIKFFFQVNIQGKVLYQISCRFHFQNIHVKTILIKFLWTLPFSALPYFGDGITMHIRYFHNLLSFHFVLISCYAWRILVNSDISLLIVTKSSTLKS